MADSGPIFTTKLDLLGRYL